MSQRPLPPSPAIIFASFVLVTLVAGIVIGCGESGREPGRTGRVAESTSMPDLTAEQAGEVVSDAMLVASQALYLAIAGPVESRAVASSDGRLRLAWSEDADFISGAGTYEITLDDYAIPADDAFAPHYYGYALTGTIVLSSQTGESTVVVFDLDTLHEQDDRFPAQRVELELAGFQDGVEDEPGGRVRVNGREFGFDELAQSF